VKACEPHLQGTLALLGNSAGVRSRLAEAPGNKGMSVKPCPGFEKPVAQIGVSDVSLVVLIGLVDPIALVPSIALFEVGEDEQSQIRERNSG
jgi:hypothetical protein